MCFDGEQAVIWDERQVRAARKMHRCAECRLLIPVGDSYVQINSLYDGHWSNDRVHAGCMALVKLIDRELCGSNGYAIGLLADEIDGQDYSDNHAPEHAEAWKPGPCPAACDGRMSTRETLEWLWELAKAPYQEVSP